MHEALWSSNAVIIISYITAYSKIMWFNGSIKSEEFENNFNLLMVYTENIFTHLKIVKKC